MLFKEVPVYYKRINQRLYNVAFHAKMCVAPHSFATAPFDFGLDTYLSAMFMPPYIPCLPVYNHYLSMIAPVDAIGKSEGSSL